MKIDLLNLGCLYQSSPCTIGICSGNEDMYLDVSYKAIRYFQNMTSAASERQRCGQNFNVSRFVGLAVPVPRGLQGVQGIKVLDVLGCLHVWVQAQIPEPSELIKLGMYLIINPHEDKKYLPQPACTTAIYTPEPLSSCRAQITVANVLFLPSTTVSFIHLQLYVNTCN